MDFGTATLQHCNTFVCICFFLELCVGYLKKKIYFCDSFLKKTVINLNKTLCYEKIYFVL